MTARDGHNPISPGGDKTAESADRTGLESPPRPTPSSLVGAAASFASSMAHFVASGFKTVDEPLHELRMSQCSPCEYRRDTQCSLCRCFIEKKAWLPHEDCPIGRWTT
jgi:hypothetical protein